MDSIINNDNYDHLLIITILSLLLLLLFLLGGRISSDAKRGDYARLLTVKKNWNHGKPCAHTN